MAKRTVEFRFLTGLKRRIFRNARLRGSWDAAGRYADFWTDRPMTEGVGDDGCPAFFGTVDLDEADAARTFRWGVLLDGPQGANFWGIPTEVESATSTDRFRQFTLAPAGAAPHVETYAFTWCRRLGAHKHHVGAGAEPGLRFRVWAPHARAVAVVFAGAGAYVYDDGRGVTPNRPVIPLTRGAFGVWESAVLPSFAQFERAPYMIQLVNAQGQTVYRTDLFSRQQAGLGSVNPAQAAWDGTVDSLDGTKGCSLVVDPDVVIAAPSGGGASAGRISTDEFWSSEFTPGVPVPSALEDLVIYELHLGSLGFGKAGPGDIGDGIAFLDHLVALGVNAVELLPMCEFSGTIGWGYGDTHHLCIESSAGGPDEYRHLVRECHRRGLAVIQDVVYNHFDPDAERAQWQYDSTAPEENLYYWYEGAAGDYPRPEDGYLDNGSTGYTPRFWEELVRAQFISSAAFLVEELHVDGLRVDLTQAIHRDNVLHQDGRSVSAANLFGQKLLREWSRTLKMIRPSVMLVAEDHSGWARVTTPAAAGGLGFDARWYADFYHHLVGDSDMSGGKGRVLKEAGYGGFGPLRMDALASALSSSQYGTVVYHESHDEAGNAGGSGRTLPVAVNGAPLVGATRAHAEARARVAFGLSLFSAGTPMFFMGEEVGAQKKYTHDTFLANREDLLGERQGAGALLFRFYQDVITLSGRLRSVRTQNIDVLHAWNDTRVIAFKRWSADEQVIVIASLSNSAYAAGYRIQRDRLAIPDGAWKELFNSDGDVYGGRNVGNRGAWLYSSNGALEAVLPANGFLVLVRQ